MLIGFALPVLQIHAIGLAQIRIGKGGLARRALHFLAGVEIALVGRAQFGSLAHARDVGARPFVEIGKARRAVAGVELTTGAGVPKRPQPPELFSLLLTLDLPTDLAKDRRKDLTGIGRQNR